MLAKATAPYGFNWIKGWILLRFCLSCVFSARTYMFVCVHTLSFRCARRVKIKTRSRAVDCVCYSSICLVFSAGIASVRFSVCVIKFLLCDVSIRCLFLFFNLQVRSYWKWNYWKSVVLFDETLSFNLATHLLLLMTLTHWVAEIGGKLKMNGCYFSRLALIASFVSYSHFWKSASQCPCAKSDIDDVEL